MTTRDPQYQTIDTTRVEVPTRLRLPQNRTDQIRMYIREEMSLAAQAQGHETFAEADDIEPDDGEDMPYSPYELQALEPVVKETPEVQANPSASSPVLAGTAKAGDDSQSVATTPTAEANV